MRRKIECTVLVKPSDWEHHACKSVHIDLIEAASNRVAAQSTQFISIYAPAIPIARNSIPHEQSAILLETTFAKALQAGLRGGGVDDHPTRAE